VKYDINKIYELPLIGQAFVLLLASLFFIGIGYQLSIANIQWQTSVSIGQQDALLKEYEATIDQQVEIKRHDIPLPELKKLLSDTQFKLITETELTGVLDDILKLGATNAIQFQSVDPKDKIKKDKFMIVPISIIMTGTYDHIARFMSQVANMPMVIKLGDFVMTNEMTDSTTPNTTFSPFTVDTPLKMQLTLEVYESTHEK